jgi:tetratricopeptide (TPR) repeat protein/S1-C subfamily serine protease
MSRSSWFLTAALVGTNMALVHPVAVAKTESEVKDIARAVVVKIQLQKAETVGSGVIINKKGNLYTLVTNRHVVCGNERCSKLPVGEIYGLGLADDQQYQTTGSNVRLLGNSLDLAIIQFRSNRNYAVAKVGGRESLKTENAVYTAGFPFTPPGFTFGTGITLAVVNKRLTGDRGGYTIIYNASTLPGMSGGGVFNSSGQLVAIHGQGDRFKENTEIEDNSRVGSKIGLNRGIPIRWLVQNLAEVGINLGTNRSISGIRTARSQVPTTADEHFIAGFNKLVEPGDNVSDGKQQAIQEFSEAIRLNPKYQHAYFMRAFTYEQIQKFQQSLSDYNQAILLNPKFSRAYNNRAILKKNKLNDLQGALSDFNQAISLDPKDYLAYSNRGNLKIDKLNDIQGALEDYNQAISLDPKDYLAYSNRGSLKTKELNDTQGALSDFNQAISLNPKDFETYGKRGFLKFEKLNDIKGALADYNQSIILNPRYSLTYYNRANLKFTKLNDIQGSREDYNQAIILNPKYSEAYVNRGILKSEKLNDIQGALEDYNQSIILNPKYSLAYYNRANLKKNKLNDIQGALEDYNQAILINSKYSEAYNNRAVLKFTKLNDQAGAIQDFRQAARLYREQGKMENLQKVLKFLQILGVSE